MTTANCPNCGAEIDAGREVCSACGYTPATGASEGSSPPAASPAPTPVHDPASASPKGAGVPSVNAVVDDLRERLGVERSPYFLAGLGFALIALVIGSLAVASYLTAGSGEIDQKFDAQVWFTLATGAAIACTALLVYVRLQSGGPPAVTQQNLQISLGLLGLTLVWTLLGLYKGLDEGIDAVDAWMSYAGVFAFLAIGWYAVARPTPNVLAGVPAATIGLVAIGVASAMLVIGLVQGRSDDFSTYVTGITWQRGGVVLMLLAFAWFAGMRPNSSR